MAIERQNPDRDSQPWADREDAREHYKQNLRDQRAKIAAEDAKPFATKREQFKVGLPDGVEPEVPSDLLKNEDVAKRAKALREQLAKGNPGKKKTA